MLCMLVLDLIQFIEICLFVRFWCDVASRGCSVACGRFIVFKAVSKEKDKAQKRKLKS
jgi:hypothetical protein